MTHLIQGEYSGSNTIRLWWNFQFPELLLNIEICPHNK